MLGSYKHQIVVSTLAMVSLPLLTFLFVKDWQQRKWEAAGSEPAQHFWVDTFALIAAIVVMQVVIVTVIILKYS